MITALAAAVLTAVLSAVEPAAAPVAIVGAADARKLCEALSPTDRLRFSGGPLERGDAEARHQAERERALSGRYQISVPAERLRFASYSTESQLLSLQRHSLPATADGAVRLHPVDESGLPVTADLATARRVLAAQAEKQLALTVTFVVPDEEDSPCFHVNGADAFTVAAEPVAWEYAAGGEVLARGGQGADRPLVSAKAGAKPRVRLGKPLDEGDGKELRGAVLDRLEELEGCYSTALDQDPWVDGAIVADLALAGRGAPEKVRIAADTVGNEALTGCVRDVLATLELQASAGRAYLPIHFVLEPPRAGSGGP